MVDAQHQSKQCYCQQVERRMNWSFKPLQRQPIACWKLCFQIPLPLLVLMPLLDFLPVPARCTQQCTVRPLQWALNSGWDWTLNGRKCGCLSLGVLLLDAKAQIVRTGVHGVVMTLFSSSQRSDETNGWAGKVRDSKS